MLKVSVRAMSITFSLCGTSSVLSENYYPPIALDANHRYALGCVGFYGYNSVPNIDEENNKFYYSVEDDGDIELIEIPIGSYEIKDIQRVLNELLIEALEGNNIKKQSDKHHPDVIQFIPNHNTLQCDMYSSTINVHFIDGSFGNLLGFDKEIYEKGTYHISKKPVDIVKITSIRVECNIITGSYYNDKLMHTLYEFPLDVPPGYSIQNTPANIIYMPLLNSDQIDNITLAICDQNGAEVNFRGERIVVRLELKKL